MYTHAFFLTLYPSQLISTQTAFTFKTNVYNCEYTPSGTL